MNYRPISYSYERQSSPLPRNYGNLPPSSYRRRKKYTSSNYRRPPPRSSRNITLKIIMGILILTIACSGIYFYSIHISNISSEGEEPVASDKMVAAFYYGWYSNSTDYSQTTPILVEDDTSWTHWGIGDPNANNDEANSRWTPPQWWFDSADPNLIETHLRQAEWAGIDALIVSFWGIDKKTYKNFQIMLRVAKYIGSKLKFTLYLETRPYKDLENSVVIDRLTNEMESVYDYFTDESQNPEKDLIWTHNGKPVFFIYVTHHIEEVAWITTLNSLASKGKSFFLNAGAPGTSPTLNSYFQGLHNYGIYIEMLKDKYDEKFLTLKNQCKQFNQLFCAGVGPGYDDTYTKPEAQHPPLDRFGGDTYRDCWENALALGPEWITICSWNEWHEGSEINPSIENGDLALRQTKSYIKIFKSAISMFNDINHQGKSITIGIGDYPWIPEVGMANDDLSSVKIPDALKVILYEHRDYSGRSWSLEDDISSLNSIGANDKVSSFKVMLKDGLEGIPY